MLSLDALVVCNWDVMDTGTTSAPRATRPFSVSTVDTPGRPNGKRLFEEMELRNII